MKSTPLFALLAATSAVLAGCAQPLHLQYDFGRAYTQSSQIQANLERPTATGQNYPLTGTEALLIRANVESEDAEAKSGEAEATATQ
jgi:hypothetical protein